MKGDIRCIDGRLLRHDPQRDDPSLETDFGKCPECNGKGCDEMEDEKMRPEFEVADEPTAILLDLDAIELANKSMAAWLAQGGYKTNAISDLCAELRADRARIIELEQRIVTKDRVFLAALEVKDNLSARADARIAELEAEAEALMAGYMKDAYSAEDIRLAEKRGLELARAICVQFSTARDCEEAINNATRAEVEKLK